eukprot:10641370-Lingulodinium_polyedra.AAC.1
MLLVLLNLFLPALLLGLLLLRAPPFNLLLLLLLSTFLLLALLLGLFLRFFSVASSACVLSRSITKGTRRQTAANCNARGRYRNAPRSLRGP